MAQNTNRINKRKASVAKEKNHHIFLFVFLFLVVVAVVIYCLLIFKPRETKPAEDKKGNETSQTEKKDTSSETSKEETSSEPKPESEKSNPQYEGRDPNTYSDLTGIINYIGANDGTLSIRVSIEQSASGTCNFTLTSPSGKSVVGSSELTIGPTSAFCSFNTPATENGTWKVTVTAISNDKRGTITGEGKI